jgi:tetraacyldisaccharide 4'-kinase
LPPSRRSIEHAWRRRGPAALLLLPLAALFALVAGIRRQLYGAGLLRSQRLPVPVVVVGNITAGGSGKTPLVVWLVEEFRRRGRRPGVISRGYGGDGDGVCEVLEGSAPARVGDEPVLIRRRTGVPVFVGRDRVAAGRALLATHDCDLLICDDGLQHYQLARDLEVAVVDRRGFLNGWPLPAGPLREPVARLATVDAVVANGWAGAAGFHMQLVGARFQQLGGQAVCVATELLGRKLHAVAGIGEPQRFFDHLAGMGLTFEAHAFPDHHAYGAGDLGFTGDAILTTEKDAVKFAGVATLPVWVLPVSATVEPDLAQFLLERLDGPAPA